MSRFLCILLIYILEYSNDSYHKIKMPKQNHQLAIIIMVFAIFVMTSQDAITKILSTHFSPFEVLFWRFLFLFIVTLIIAGQNKRRRGTILKSHNPKLQFLRCLVYFIESAMFITIVRTLGIAEIHAVFASVPLVVTAMSPWLLGERVGIYRWSAVGVGFIGVLIIIKPGYIPFNFTTFLLICSVFLYATFQILNRKLYQDSAETSMLWFSGFVTIASFLIIIWDFKIPDMKYWGYFLGLSFLGGFSHFLNLQAFRYAPAPVLQPFMFTMFVFAVMWSYLIFDNIPDTTSFIGAGVVIASGLFTFYREQYVKRRLLNEKKTQD